MKAKIMNVLRAAIYVLFWVAVWLIAMGLMFTALAFIGKFIACFVFGKLCSL